MTRMGPDPDSRNGFALETPRLTVDLPAQSDAQTLFHLNGGEHRREVNATLLWDGADSVEEIEQWIDKCSSDPYRDFGYHWVIRDKTGSISGGADNPLGAIGTRPRAEPGRADVGYWLGRPFWGKGVMTEALTALLDLCFDELSNYKVEADVYTHNARGLRLVERVGMRQEGMIRRAHRKYGEWVDITIWGILVEEWEQLTR